MKKKISLTIIVIVLLVIITLLVYNKDDIQLFQNDIDTSWDISPFFEHDNFIFQGKKERIGISNITGEEETTFIANQRDIYIWHFFGPLKSFGDEIRIKATSKELNESVDILTTTRKSAEIPFANFSIPMDNGESSTGVQIQENITSQSILFNGIWRFDVYFENRYFDSIVIEFK